MCEIIRKEIFHKEYKTIAYTCNGILHRDDGPALTVYRLENNKLILFKTEFYQMGKLHSLNNNPSCIINDDENNTKSFWHNCGKLIKVQQKAIDEFVTRLLTIDIDKQNPDDPTITHSTKDNITNEYINRIYLWCNVDVNSLKNTDLRKTFYINNFVKKIYNNFNVMTLSSLSYRIIIFIDHYTLDSTVYSRLNGPAIIFDDFINTKMSFQHWVLNGSSIPEKYPKISRTGTIIGNFDKNQIIDIMLENREYGAALNKAMKLTLQQQKRSQKEPQQQQKLFSNVDIVETQDQPT